MNWAKSYETCSQFGPERGDRKVGIPEFIWKAAIKSDDWTDLGLLEMAKQLLVSKQLAYIHEGWDRPGKELSCVYSGYPETEIIRPKSDGNGEITRTFPVGYILSVFILEDGSIDEVVMKETRQRTTGTFKRETAMALSMLEESGIRLEDVQNFKPYMIVSKEGDAITFKFKPDPYYSERLNDFVSLYLSRENDDVIVGCRIKCIEEALRELPQDIQVNHRDSKLTLYFTAFKNKATSVAERLVIAHIEKQTNKIPEAERELQAC